MLKNLQFLVIHFSAAMKSVHHWTKWKSPCLLCVYKSACALFFVAFSSCFVACYTLTYTWLKNEDQATPECGLSSRLSVDLPCLLDAFTLVWLSTGWLILFPVPSFSCPEKPQRRHPGGISTRCPNHLIWLLSRWRISSSTPSSLQMTGHLILFLNLSAVNLYIE